jgi:hypothetical protein
MANRAAACYTSSVEGIISPKRGPGHPVSNPLRDEGALSKGHLLEDELFPQLS